MAFSKTPLSSPQSLGLAFSFYRDVGKVPFRPDPFLTRFEPLRKLRKRHWVGYAAAVGGIAAAAGLGLGLGDLVKGAPFVTFYLFVILATLVGGLRPGLLAVVLSALAADYLFLPPAFGFAWTASTLFTVGVYIVVATAMVVTVALLNEAVDRLWRHAANMQFILETEPTGLLAVGQDGTIELANRAAETQFGYTSIELIGRPIEILVPESERAGHAALRDSYMAQPVHRAMGAGRDLAGLRKDGTTMPVEIGLTPFERDGRKGALATITDISERKAAERRQQILAREIRHRGKNLLTVVQAVAAQIFTPESTAPEVRKEFFGALRALARAHDLFLETGSVSLAKLVEMELKPFKERVSIDIPDIPLTASAAQDFALIVHELATNAVKYGALSTPSGHVSLTGHENGRELAFAWEESDGPPVLAPARRGFGHTILVNVAQNFCIEVASEYAPAGFRYHLKADLARISMLVDLAAWRAGSA
jgi:PAS domain S-box-containing protein